jgi:hypothetical protein
MPSKSNSKKKKKPLSAKRLAKSVDPATLSFLEASSGVGLASSGVKDAVDGILMDRMSKIMNEQDLKMRHPTTGLPTDPFDATFMSVAAMAVPGTTPACRALQERLAVHMRIANSFAKGTTTTRTTWKTKHVIRVGPQVTRCV